MTVYRAESTGRLDLPAGATFVLESLRQAVVPPYVLIVPFLELPPCLELLKDESLDVEGVHGATYTVRALAPGAGILRLGFRDLRTSHTVREKAIEVSVA